VTVPRRVAVLAALKDELAPLAGYLSGLRVERLENLKIRRGELSGFEVILAVTGDGEIAARRGAARLLEEIRPDVVFAVGVAGGLSPGLEPGQVVVAERVMGENGTAMSTDPEWLTRGLSVPGTRRGTILSATRIAVTPEDKARLHRQVGADGAAVVDLESAAFVAEALGRGLPCLVARAVCDTAEEALPLDFNRFRTAAGGVSQGRVLRHALTHPGVVEALMGLRDRVRSCSRTLAELVAEVLER
jgi:nucleoside phosphorylase